MTSKYLSPSCVRILAWLRLLQLRELIFRFPDGDNDWMDPQGGAESVERMRAAGNNKGRMYIISHAGHHRKSFVILCDSCQAMLTVVVIAVYLDNPRATNDLIVKELDRD